MMKEQFQAFVQAFQNSKDYKKPLGFGIARIDFAQSSEAVLCATFPLLNWEGENLGSYAVFCESAKKANLIHKSESEAIYEITPEFIKTALDLFKPFVIEALNDKQSHKNIQIILQLEQNMRIDQAFESVIANDESNKKQSKDVNIDTLIKKITDNNCMQEEFEYFLSLANNNNTLMSYLHGSKKPLFSHNIPLSHYRFCVIYNDSKCESVESAYMKLLALSLGKAPLRSLMLDGIFGLLQNVAWSGNKPYELEWLRANEIALKMQGLFPAIDFVDKFPRYLMQVIPQFDNIRLLDSAKTRFGAYLGSGGYTQMPGASYVNFNAGAMGACMNEGRISSSVVVGEGTDVGGGASILGVLSGGNSEPISIGKNCLLGVNSSTGISLGDGCIVDGGIAVLAGTIFEIKPEEAKKIAAINTGFIINESGLYKGRELSGRNGVHFRQDSKSGKMIAFRSSRTIELNKALH